MLSKKKILAGEAARSTNTVKQRRGDVCWQKSGRQNQSGDSGRCLSRRDCHRSE